MIENRHGNAEELGWEEFWKAFYDKYYPRSFWDAKWNQFLKLVLDLMSVAKYEKKYTKLSKYATSIIQDEIDKFKRFEDGLREEI